MILISYVKPYVVVRSDELISGQLSIVNNEKTTLWDSEFFNKDYLSVKVKKEWDRKIKIILKTKGKQIKKDFTV